MQYNPKMNLVKTTTKIYSQGSYRNLFHIFLNLIVFWEFIQISIILKEIKKLKTLRIVMGRLRPTP
jgi:hypothetical protein